MATIYTHAVFGLGLGVVYARRPMPWTFWALASFLAIVPDFDVFSRAAYGSVWGHRGVTHTLAFALWLGFLVATLTFRYFRTKLWTLTLFWFVVIASHGVLDALTRGGFGIPFFWPASEARYGPWGPIHLSDIGFEFPDPRTSAALQSELLWVWLPTIAVAGFVIAWRSRRKRHAPDAREAI